MFSVIYRYVSFFRALRNISGFCFFVLFCFFTNTELTSIFDKEYNPIIIDFGGANKYKDKNNILAFTIKKLMN